MGEKVSGNLEDLVIKLEDEIFLIFGVYFVQLRQVVSERQRIQSVNNSFVLA